jgi:hypothetical protein
MKADEATRALHDAAIDLLVAAESRESEPSTDVSPTGSDEATWGPREVLAHVLWWHERYLAVLSAKVDDRPRPRLPGGLDDINLVGIETYGRRSMSELRAAIRSKEHALESLTAVLFERPDAATIRIVTRDESAPISLDAFVERVTGHLRGHARDLRG